MPKRLSLIAFFFLLYFLLPAQREHTIASVDTLTDFDGHYQHPVWQNIPELEEFVTFFPNPGQKPLQTTRVKMLYTRSGIYVMAHCESTKVRDDGSIRDKLNDADYVSVRLDTWLDRQNDFVFTITAAGQINDDRSNNADFDAWWRGKARKVADGWVAEMFIPFTALRFPDRGEQVWGLQVIRFDRSTGETSNWNPQNPYINDNAWQYGKLKGLVSLKQKTRLGLAILSNFNNLAINMEQKDVITAGVDGRLGLGSATTLDFTLLPNFALLSPALDGGGFSKRPNPAYPTPRQFAADEANVYHKTQVFTPDFNMDASWFGTNIPLLPGESLLSTTPPQKGLSATLSSRMRGGIGLVASHTTYENPETFYASMSPFSSSVRAIQTGRPNHTNLSVEKLFRNNSWVNFSHNLFVVGNDFIKNQSGLSLQLRDKSNHYQLAATGRTSFDDNDRYTDISVGKVNGSWTWKLEYFNQKSFTKGSFFVNSTRHQEFIKMEAAKTNFQPRNPWWLRTQHGVFVRRDEGFNSISFGVIGGGTTTQRLDDRWFASYHYSALNRKFETFSAGLAFVPSYSPREINVLGGKFRANRYVPFSMNIGYATDQRKRWQVSTNAGANFRLNNDQKVFTLNVTPAYVPNKVLRLRITNTFFLQPNRLANAPQIQVPNAVTRIRNFGLTQRYDIELFASRKLYFAFFQYYDLHRFFFKAYRFNEQIDLEPYGYAYTLNPARNTDIQSTLRASWFFAPNSQLRLTYERVWLLQTNMGEDGLLFITGLPANEVLGSSYTNLNIALIWNLSRH